MLKVLVPLLVAVFATVSANSADVEPIGENGSCLSCHIDAGHLMQVVKSPDTASEDSCAAAPSRPAFLSAFVNPEFPKSRHGEIGCTGCHGGNAESGDPTVAHKGMKPANTGCADCHEKIAAIHATSLHATLNGMAHALKLRSGEEQFHKLVPMWQKDCASCHATCSDCHVTLPQAVGGGLIKGHTFFKRPPMAETCVVCHASRAGGEYLGHFPGVAPDVHFEKGMHCLDCHKNNLHGDGQSYSNRWDVAGRPKCTDCHPALPNKKTKAHSRQHKNVSCQVCHAQPYQNCFSCHATVEDGTYNRRAGNKALAIKIGNNTVPGYPYGTVTVRSNPVARNSFTFFGTDLLPHFDRFPTWKTAAPHNIRRAPEQSRTCDDCHKNDQLFLTTGDLDPDGAAANAATVIPQDDK